MVVTCYGGVNEIGGNKILVQDRDTLVFLDFGAGFSEGGEYFSAGIEPRRVNGAADDFEFGLLLPLRVLTQKPFGMLVRCSREV